MKRLLSVLACAALVAALAGIAVPAHAGTGNSTLCSDGGGSGTEVRIVDWPITFNLEAGALPTYVQVCFSTTPKGDATPALIGEFFLVQVGTSSAVSCASDNPTVVALDCAIIVTPSGVSVSLTPRLQSISLPIGAGVGGTVGGLACLHDLTIATPAGVFGPFDVGVCA